MAGMMDRREAKFAARAAARVVRGRTSAAADGAEFAVRDVFLDGVAVPADAVVAAYWPTGSELDVRPLLFHLFEAGHTCALPVVAEQERPLVFRTWTPETVLVAGRFGIMEPVADAGEVVPSVLLVPLLAFDRGGHRLGYGAGFYDRTLQVLRDQASQGGGPVLAVGIGFAAQEVPLVPCDEYDQKLDWMVTEQSALKIE